ncbi:hypothetical protein HK097_000895 [Rhizophlyctis rosea]|uniref:Uncharacterized protein n=1 Tax=Rhizophlyctis rosea TaxID=64517 RepID=A0AAD5S662_9FUNG|nr:hypothetical protein HK097_000895 [Rhizophlyctis rosea]
MHEYYNHILPNIVDALNPPDGLLNPLLGDIWLPWAGSSGGDLQDRVYDVLAQIAAFLPTGIAEIGARTGYWSELLQADVTAVDSYAENCQRTTHYLHGEPEPD